MGRTRILGVILLVLGVLGLLTGGFSYTKDKDSAHIGPITLEVKEKEHVNVPLWAGVAVVVVGAFLLARKD